MTSYRTYEPHVNAAAGLDPHQTKPRRRQGGGAGQDHAPAGSIMPPVYVNAAADGYRIRDGHHRVAAARLAGFDAVPCLVVSE